MYSAMAKPRSMADSGYTSAEFQEVRRALLACNDADRAYFKNGSKNGSLRMAIFGTTLRRCHRAAAEESEEAHSF